MTSQIIPMKMSMEYQCYSSTLTPVIGGVGDVLVWRRDGAYVEFGFQ